VLEHSGDLEASVDLARGRLSMCLQTGTMQAGCVWNSGRRCLQARGRSIPCGVPGELIRNVESLSQWGKGQLCTTELSTTELSTTVRHKRTTCRTAGRRHSCTIETLQPPTGTNSVHKGGISFANPPHTSPLFTSLSSISSEPGGSTDICQQRRSTAVGTYMKSQTRIQSSAHARPSMLYFSNSRVDMM
jgi:hypothetical protein